MSVKEDIKNIKIKTWLKSIWWLILVILLILVLSKRIIFILNGTAQPFDIFLFLILVSLLLIPLFQEIELFGIKFKRELEEVKKELTNHIISLRTDINNKIDLQNQSNQNFYINPQNIPKDSELSELKKSFDKLIEELHQENKKNFFSKNEVQVSITDDTNFLFSVRYSIEDELRNILKRLNIFSETTKFLSINYLLELIEAYVSLDRKILDMLKKIYAICSLAVHAKDVSRIQIDFVKDVYPDLINYLRNVKAGV